jgi:hypothetical protein
VRSSTATKYQRPDTPPPEYDSTYRRRSRSRRAVHFRPDWGYGPARGAPDTAGHHGGARALSESPGASSGSGGGGGGGGFFRGSPKIRWDPEEEQRLVELVEATGTSNWHLKAAQLATGRTGPAVQQHWRVFLSAYQRQHGQMCVRAVGAVHPPALLTD